MAQAFAAPIDPPDITLDQLRDGSYEQIETDYIEKLATMAREHGNSPLLGKEIRFPRGDGYARFLVWNTRPLDLIWLQLGDAWDVEDALIRGLRVSDVKEMIEREESLNALFSKSTTGGKR